MKTLAQHYLHPLHIWCKVLRGHYLWLAKWYEVWVWNPLIRRALK
jgi:hypothetical protein